MNVLLLAPLLAALQSSVPAIVAAKNPVISCTAKAGDTRAFLVSIANRSSTRLVTRIVPSVQLGRDEIPLFWAPFDLAGQPLGPNSPIPISISANEAAAIQVDLDGLRWASAVSSMWPSQPLVATVPPGHYRVNIRVEGGSGAPARWYTIGSCPSVIIPEAPIRTIWGGA
jgi:hypothetical protein